MITEPAEPAEKILVVYAYAVKPVHFGPGGVEFKDFGEVERDETGAFKDNRYRVFYQTEYLHYWVDDKLKYGEEVRPTAEVPRLNFVSGGYKVHLHGPKNYTISG